MVVHEDVMVDPGGQTGGLGFETYEVMVVGAGQTGPGPSGIDGQAEQPGGGGGVDVTVVGTDGVHGGRVEIAVVIQVDEPPGQVGHTSVTMDVTVVGTDGVHGGRVEIAVDVQVDEPPGQVGHTSVTMDVTVVGTDGVHGGRVEIAVVVQVDDPPGQVGHTSVIVDVTVVVTDEGGGTTVVTGGGGPQLVGGGCGFVQVSQDV
ncbi:hypothetical protein M409DRAFT_27128 [Zasmidium cellare ATCC 36951]|uniref:Uncharacterized protein n=1 Tax=Zasmidium cellare ATCC 36951 TaxID=1080233 RepID=A0A6A6C5X1_ZASCE|nr:uncharacterized protein M409DRAFT_27128 [Zasmidium cellare ATCC 36951]KAF2162504.1 hypothetical protein M409DRAFT_27128 [Zasmidium cellare ATCC 36951]